MINCNDIYYLLCDEEKRHNPFETSEGERLHNEVYKLIEQQEDNGFNCEILLADLIDNERCTAFEVGYKTALKMLFDGLGNLPKYTSVQKGN